MGSRALGPGDPRWGREPWVQDILLYSSLPLHTCFYLLHMHEHMYVSNYLPYDGASFLTHHTPLH
eukprot:2646325-Pyramimonas_sp.AAC.1